MDWDERSNRRVNEHMHGHENMRTAFEGVNMDTGRME